MKGLTGYFVCIAIAVLMTVMIDGKGGLLIAVILLTALIVSLIYKRYFIKRLKITVATKHRLLAKGDKVEVRVTVTKQSRLPSPILEFELAGSAQFSPEDKNGLRFAIRPDMNTKAATVVFNADYSGSAYIRLTRFEIIDFLGLGHHLVPFDEKENTLELSVMPRVPDTGTQMDVIRTATDNLGFDDSEEETSETAMGSTGTPGYEHRTYNPGDPLKKINWKLSSKRSIYMVRLDEKLSVTSQVFTLDLPAPPEGEAFDCRRADNIIEGALAMLAMLSQQGLETDFYYYIDKWECQNIKTYGDVYLLSEKLALMKPYSGIDRIPAEALRSGNSLCFTTVRADQGKLVSDLFAARGVTFVVTADSGFDTTYGSLWTCSEQFEFKHLN
ncbi:MAG: DUF58 domain-containing protein [Ruminococcus sp.]|nr:DUF58 domain-containing protein [Ruminococcus sp.]